MRELQGRIHRVFNSPCTLNSGVKATVPHTYPATHSQTTPMHGGKNAGKTLMLFGFSGLAMMFIGLVYPDREIAKFFFISGGLFLSIMWPSIFDLAIAGLGKNTGKASSFLIMMILGGGVIPLIQGRICDFDLTSPEGIFSFLIIWNKYIFKN